MLKRGVIPLTTIDLSGDLTANGSNCISTISVTDGEVIPVTVTIETDAAELCGFDEEITDRTVDIDMSNLEIAVTDGVGNTTGCPVANILLQAGDTRDQAETYLSQQISLALGDLNALLADGTDCGFCSGSCDGLSCVAPTP